MYLIGILTFVLLGGGLIIYQIKDLIQGNKVEEQFRLHGCPKCGSKTFIYDKGTDIDDDCGGNPDIGTIKTKYILLECENCKHELISISASHCSNKRIISLDQAAEIYKGNDFWEGVGCIILLFLVFSFPVIIFIAVLSS